MSETSRRYRSYTGLAYLFVAIFITIWGNVLLQSTIFPVFPYPLFISLVSYAFPILYVIKAQRSGYSWEIWRKYLRIAPFTLLNSLASGIMYNWSLLLTSMSAVTVITSSSTLFSLLFSWLLLGTSVQWSTIISIHLSIVGSILVVASSSGNLQVNLPSDGIFEFKTDSDESYSEHVAGCILALISSACSGLSTVLFQKFEIRHTDAYLTVSGLSASVYTVIFLALNSQFHWESLSGLNWDIWSLLSLNGIVSSVIGTNLFIRAMMVLSPVTVNVLWSLSIPFSVVVDFYRGAIHTVTPSFLLGALLVLLSTVMVPIEQDETRLADAELRREIPLLVISEETMSPSNNSN